MNRDDIIRMAIEAGAKPSHNPEEWDILKIRDTDFERFAALVAAAKQEEIESTLMRLHEQAADRHNYFQHAIKVLRGEA